MALHVPDVGKVRLLDMLVDGDGFSGVRCRLYKNSVTISDATVLGDFTEANFSGYSQSTPSFGSASIVSGKGKIIEGSFETFIHNGGGTSNSVYGYYVVDSATPELLWAEAFPSPISVANNGDEIDIKLALTMTNE